ncbi:hypothetical protein CHS0354_020306 [Potamilus streckersoni]|uniref:WASH complex subunit 3 n=1 Tax=Potamilus streckersoni TaxID=2493646 RepID=A0AAE0VQR2_9BIVA|nr:hypothetical protein CHS0354_020306 [Potamilus streckersoni]
MDADGLPLVGPGVNYTKVEALNQKRIIAFLNHFITHSASFLNRFSCVCEEKLEHLSSRLQQLEITLNILEAKLASIPGLEGVTAPSSSSASAGVSSSTSSNTAPQSGPPPPPPASPMPMQAEQPVEKVETQQNPVSKDPRYMRFFKMLQVGVPETAVKMKMSAEGLDPNLLNNPDAPAPAADKTNDEEDSDSSEVSSFSDSD